MISRGRKSAGGFINREIFVFAFFLLLSFIFWYLNELGKELDATIKYPVRYVNPPKERIITGDLPRKLDMELRGPGYSILKMKLSGSKAPVVIDFSRAASRKLPGPKPHYYLITSGMIQEFSKQLHADFDIISIKPDTIFFGYDRLVTRRLPVIPDLDTEISSKTRIVVVAEPDSVTVKGPAHVLDTVKGIHTKYRFFKRMDETFKTSVPLECPEYLETSEKRVVLEITVLEKPSPFFNLRYQKSNR